MGPVNARLRDRFRSRAERLDFIQNVTIAVLSVSALLLFSRTEMFRMGWETAGERFLLAAETGIPSRSAAKASLTAPVRAAVTNVSGRRGDLFLTTDGEAFQSLRTVLSAALSEGDAEACQRADFLRALNAVSLYCDFLHPLPVPLLAGLLGASGSPALEARCLALAEEGSGTVLYFWDGSEGYWRQNSPVTRQELEEAVELYRGGNAAFAMDHSDPEENQYRSVSPLSLLPARTPSLPVLSASGGAAGTDALLTALRFNPLTNSRYPEANGTEVVVEGSRTVRLRANGSVYYQSGGQGGLWVDSAGEVPTLWEAAAGSAALLQSLQRSGGAGTLYLLEAHQKEGNRTVLRFGYQFSGVPIRTRNGQNAAEVVLDGRTVVSLEFQPRLYTAAEWESLLLPLPQALAVAALRPDRELSVGYADSGGSQVDAHWMAG